MLTLRRITFVLIVFAVSCSATQSQEKLRVLFIGNSLTYTNDIPALVASLALSTKQKRLEFETIAYPDFSLEDHWQQGDARREISKGNWNFVVLQQGPSALPESRILLREYVSKFAADIKRAGAKPAIFMVWPAVSRRQDFDRVIESYQLAASDVDAVLLPVGAVWREVFKTNAELSLYSRDNFHPSQKGAFVAAWVIFRCLYNNTAVSMPDHLSLQLKDPFKIELKQFEVVLLSEATNKVLLDHK